jgi:hypothetical protein
MHLPAALAALCLVPGAVAQGPPDPLDDVLWLLTQDCTNGLPCCSSAYARQGAVPPNDAGCDADP